MVRWLSVLCFALLFACGSSGEVNSEEAYVKWLNNEKNGLIKTKYIGELKLTVKYLPPDYVVYREVKSGSKKYSKEEKEKMLAEAKNTRTFILTIGPDERKKGTGDIMFYNVKGEEDYTFRAEALNYNMDKYVYIGTGKISHAPKLHVLENTYGLTTHRDVYLVFADDDEKKDLLKADTLDFVFNDEIFGTGISHFSFSRKDLNNVPAINFWTN